MIDPATYGELVQFDKARPGIGRIEAVHGWQADQGVQGMYAHRGDTARVSGRREDRSQ